MENIKSVIETEKENSLASEVETTGEQESSVMEVEPNEQESVLSETGHDDNEGKSRETTWVDDLQVENDATVAGTLRAHKLVTDMADTPEKDGHGFYSSGAAYDYTPTHIDIDDSRQADNGIVSLSLRNADNKLLGIVSKLYTGISEKDRNEIENGSSAGIKQLKAWIENALDKLQWQYLSKEHDDTTDHNVGMGGLAVNGNASVSGNAFINHDLTVLGEAVLNTVRSTDYDNASEQGFSIEKDAGGSYQAFMANLTVWGKAVFHELEIRKLSYAGGNVYLSGAGSKIVKSVPVRKATGTDGIVAWVECEAWYDDDCAGWKCYLLADDGTTATMNHWQEGDQVRCQTMGEITSAGSYENVANRSYWRTIPDGGVSAANEKIYGTKTETYTDADGKEHTRETQVELYDGQAFAWIVIGKHAKALDGYLEEVSPTDPDTPTAPMSINDKPQDGDTIVLDGNRHRGTDGLYDKRERQNVIVLETSGDYAPRIASFANITEYKHTVTKTVDGKKKEVSLSVFETSPKGGTKINSSMFEFVADDGSMANILNYRGDWSSASTYHKNDQVNHLNAVWVCVANSGVDVTEEPNDTASYWKKVLSGGKGADGADAVTYELVAQPGYIKLGADGSIDRGNQYSDGKYMLVSGYKVVGGKRISDWWKDDDKFISVMLSFNGGSAYYETAYGRDVFEDDIQTDFDPYWTDSYSSIIEEIGKNGLRNCKAILYEGMNLDPDKIPSDKVLATLDIPIVQDGKQGNDGEPGTSPTVYEVQVSSYSQYTNGNRAYGLRFLFAKAVGAERQVVTDVREIGCKVAISAGGWNYNDAAAYVNGGKDSFLFSSYPVNGDTMDEADNITVEMYLLTDTDNDAPVAVANFANGKQGADGKGALEISVSPDTLVFDTDDNGVVSSTASQTATITCVRDGEDVTGTCTIYKDGELNCTGSVKSNVVTISGITTQTVGGVTVSNTYGYVRVRVSDPSDGTSHAVTVKFTVNVARFNGGISADNKTLKSQYSELTNDGSITDLTDYRSKILQSAREISLHVSEKRAGRRNLLVGSAFRKQGEGPLVNNTLNLTCVNGGYDGTNCIRATNTYPGSGDGRYIGAFWDGSQGVSSIKIERGKKYTLSVWAKCDNVNATIALETIFTDKLTSAKSMRKPKSTTAAFKVSKAGEWQLLQCTIDTSLFNDGTANTLYDCLAVNVYCNHKLTDASGNGLTVNAWFCRPMLEEGEEYNGWTLSEQDYDYVGGNLLDGTATLAKTGNVETLDGTVTQGGMGESASVMATLSPTATATTEIDFLQFSTSGMGLKANEDYILSFYAMTNANPGKLQCYLYPSDGKVYTEDSEGGYDNTFNSNDGQLRYAIVPGKTWKRYWVHWRPTMNDPRHVLFRLRRGGNDRGDYDSTEAYAVDDVVLYNGTYWHCLKAGTGNTPPSSSSSTSSYWERRLYRVIISQPKLEVGATMTEYTSKRADMVDKAALYATGIDIDSKRITLTASNTTFRDNDGTELAVIDNEGLRASKIATTDNGGGHTVISGNSTVWYQKDGVTPGIAVFYDAAGVPHFQFYGTDGSVKYDFGPSGLQSFISSTQQAYSDTAYLRNAKPYVDTSGTTVTGFDWVYVAKNQDADKCYVWRKQIPTTDTSKNYDIYDGCVFTKEYYNTVNSENWPKPGFLLDDGWYVEPNDGNLPMKIRPADDEGVLDPTQTVYYQTFYKYEGGKVSRTVRAYMKKVSDTLVSKFKSTGEWDEI